MTVKIISVFDKCKCLHLLITLILLGQNSQIKEETSAEYSPKQAATRQVDIKMLNSF